MHRSTVFATGFRYPRGQCDALVRARADAGRKVRAARENQRPGQ
jgi:hypothetical protein